MNIGIIEDNHFFRERLKEEITKLPDFHPILVTDSVEEYRKWYNSRLQVDVILLDINLPGMSGLDAIYILKKENPEVDIIILTINKDSNNIFKALRAGAIGYLLKSGDLDIGKELGLVKTGGSPVSPSIARSIFEHFNPPKSIFKKKNKQSLTNKETVVINHLVQGMSHKMIAEQMGISVNGVYFHLKNIYKKLQVNSKTEVMKKYLDGLIDL